MNIDKSTTMYINWSKHENDLMVYYPNHQGKYFGYEIMKTITKEIEEYATDFDITSVKVQIKLKPQEDNNDR